MSQELLYTSAPRGLKPGSRGFCTVLSTQGMAAPLATALEGLSGYRPVFPTGDPRAGRNPIVYSHVKLQSGGRTWNVLSRIADFGLDYSQRSNKLAHHVVLDRSELQAGGPANLLSTPDFIRTDWDGEPQLVATRPPVRESRPRTGICVAWQEMTGDAGWAGVLAESFLHDPDRLVILLFAPGQDLLPLFAESISLLPPERRWEVTFSTYFTGLSAGTTCVWRGMVKDSKEAHDSLRFVGALRLDITEPSIGRASGATLVELSRHGRHRPTLPSQPSDRECQTDTVEGAANTASEVPHESEATHSSTRDIGNTIRIAHVPPRLTRVNQRSSDSTTTKPKLAPSRMWLWILLVSVLGVLAILPLLSHYRDQSVENYSNPRIDSASASNHTPQPNPSVTPALPLNTPAAQPVKSLTSHDGSPMQQATNPITASKHDLAPPGIPNESVPTQTPASSHASQILPPAKPAGGAIPTSPTRNVPRIMQVPLRGEKSLVLYKPSGPSKEIAISVLKPEWVSYEFGNPRTHSDKNARFAIFAPGTTDDKTQIAVFTQQQGNPIQQQDSPILLKTLNDESCKWLWWCRVRVIDTRLNTLLDEIAFTKFPIDSAEFGRTIRKPTKWELPRSGPFEDARRPKLILSRMRIAINNQEYRLEIPPSPGGAELSVPLSEFGTSTYETFACKSAAVSQLNLVVAFRFSEQQSPIIELRIDGKKKFLSPIESELHTKINKATNDVVSHCKLFDTELGRLVENQLMAVSVADKSGSDNGPSVDSAIDSRINELHEALKKMPDEKRKELLKVIVADIRSVSRLFNAIRDFRDTAEYLDSVTVTSARVHYEVFDARSPKIPVEIDVIDFDDSSVRDASTERSNDRSGGDK